MNIGFATRQEVLQLAWHYLTNVLMQSQRLRPNWAMDNCPGPPPNAKTLGTATGWWRRCCGFCWETKIDVKNQQTCIIFFISRYCAVCTWSCESARTGENQASIMTTQRVDKGPVGRYHTQQNPHD